MLAYYKIDKENSVYEMAEAILKKEENFIPYMYVCSKGILTIFWGRNLIAHPFNINDLLFIQRRLNFEKSSGVKRLNAIKKVGDFYLSELITDLQKQLVNYTFYDGQPKIIQAVLVCLAYQMGVAGLLGFKKTLRFCEEKNYPEMARELLDSTFAREETPGRAKRMSKLILEVV